ncbi:hypothetical protein [Helicobacter mehlei]|uniref:Lipoprotein n=1 Tax=Helicobacter mehlei TaxID=2316080 RepID=A0A553UPI3_9HELI|nr:hypothetical protein [Helicobacter mehlei]TSA82102.1 hypothetical protein FNE76_06065 [Helicobacter mehlei]
MHTRVLLGILGVFVLVFVGCSSVIAARVPMFQYTMHFNASDFDVGPVVSAQIRYDASDPHIYELLLNKAIAANKCDTILLPRYEVIGKTFGRDILRLTGRCSIYKER